VLLAGREPESREAGTRPGDDRRRAGHGISRTPPVVVDVSRHHHRRVPSRRHGRPNRRRHLPAAMRWSALSGSSPSAARFPQARLSRSAPAPRRLSAVGQSLLVQPIAWVRGSTWAPPAPIRRPDRMPGCRGARRDRQTPPDRPLRSTSRGRRRTAPQRREPCHGPPRRRWWRSGSTMDRRPRRPAPRPAPAMPSAWVRPARRAPRSRPAP